MQSRPSHTLGTGTTALQAALLQQAQDNDEWLHAMEQAGRMAKAALGNQPEMLRILDERVIESRESFPHPWANIPVHKHTQIPRIIERLQQPLSTYEEAVAAINGLDSVVVRRLHEDDIGWPNDQDWLTMLEFPTRCRTCSADAGHHCVGSRDRRVKRHKNRQPPLPRSEYSRQRANPPS